MESVLLEWKKDAVIDRSKLAEESINTYRLHSKYTEMLAAVKRDLTRLRERLKKLKHDKKEWYGGKMSKADMDDREWDYDPLNGRSKPLKGEMQSWVDVDKEVSDLTIEIKDMEDLSDVLVDVINNLNWRHQSIRNAIEWEKFVSGG